ncbi:sugar phosphate isomerase/epimerase [Rhodococcus sp. H36-A4]|uniref:sugar phosphate isomerase/epimerase family protein n=1 Tax=Rhodococcus sp. H36-A4 TaxID=3004353 RepID=UPI0022AE652C|nr:sugar phosphate isomerase/epimerase [Rhodococcus sp. H36-A4]MCZ4078211.1 sugar phosphate isomerase/epimerase [Rhodococcus sp. H36-A4]
MANIRIAGAPISWGVCEVPGWGYQMAAEQVLREMRDAGLTATEVGPEGFLPMDPGELSATLERHHLECVGGFAPVLLHHAQHDPVPGITPLLDAFVTSRAEVLVLAAATGMDGYDSRPELDDAQWDTLLDNLDRMQEAGAERGVRVVLHPHVGTVVEKREEVHRVLEGSAIPLCLDTGHLLIGGIDPLELVEQHTNRITHAHVKDVDSALAARVRGGELTYTDAVAEGMYTRLGTGDVDIAGVVNCLLDAEYEGWFVLEQDTILASEPTDAGPVAEAIAGVRYLRSVVDSRRRPGHRVAYRAGAGS